MSSEVRSAVQAGRPRRRRTGRRYGVRWHGFGAGIHALGRVPAHRLGSYPSPGHAYVDKTAVVMPDRVNAGTKCRN